MVAPVVYRTAPKILSDLVLWEEELAYSREIAGTVLNTTVTVIGTPIALDANSKLVPLTADGSLVCIGVAISYRQAQVADTVGDIQYLRRTAMLKDSGIVWPTGISPTNIAKALGEIEVRGVIVRPTA